MRDYELTLIFHPDVGDEAGQDALLEKIKGQIAAAGGQDVQVEPWGRRPLAYPIKKVTEGYYFLIRMQFPPQAVSELERALRLTEPVLRFLLMRVNK